MRCRLCNINLTDAESVDKDPSGSYYDTCYLCQRAEAYSDDFDFLDEPLFDPLPADGPDNDDETVITSDDL